MEWLSPPSQFSVRDIDTSGEITFFREESIRGEIFVLDSPDGVLFSAGTFLVWINARLELHNTYGVLLLPWLELENGRLFVKDLPDGVFRSRLETAAEGNELFCYGPLPSSIKTLAVLNAQGKGIANLRFGTISGFRWLEVEPFKGYGPDVEPLKNTLRQRCTGYFLVFPPCLFARETGAAPWPKKRQALVTDTPAVAALQRAASEQLETALTFFKTFLANKDPEVLHNARIFLRKARTVVSLCRRLDPCSVTMKEKEFLARLARVTNTARDLEVFLTRRSAYESLIPSFFVSGLQTFFEDVCGKAEGEMEKVIGYLKTGEGLKRLDALSGVIFKRSFRIVLGSGSENIQDYIHPHLHRCFRKLRKTKRLWENSTGNEDLAHRLRVMVKKYRYLLEIFETIIGASYVALWASAARKAQNALGRLHDLDVQVAFILKEISSIVPRASQASEKASALGALVSMITLERDSFVVKAIHSLRFLEKRL